MAGSDHTRSTMLAEGPWRWPRLQNKGSMCEAQAASPGCKPRLLAKASSRGCYSRRSSRGVGFWRGFEPRLLLAAFESRRRRTLVL